MKIFRLLMVAMIFVGLILSAFGSIASASDCGGGSYKDDNWNDEKSEVSMAWAETPGFNCPNGIESVTFAIKAGLYDEGPPNSCYSAEWDQDGWKVWENWSSEEEKNEKGCQDISHVIVEWKCACPIPTPTATLPVDETPTATLPVEETPTSTTTLPVDETPTATLPVDETPTATLPVDETPTATLPVEETTTATPQVEKTPTPTITTTPVRVNTGTVMPTAGAGIGGPTAQSIPIRWSWLIISLIGTIGLGGSYIPSKRQDA